MEERPRIIDGDNEDLGSDLEKSFSSDEERLKTEEYVESEVKRKSKEKNGESPKRLKGVIENIFSKNSEANPKSKKERSDSIRETEIKIDHKKTAVEDLEKDLKSLEADFEQAEDKVEGESYFDKRHEIKGNEDTDDDVTDDPDTVVSVGQPTRIGSILASKLSVGELNGSKVAGGSNNQKKSRAVASNPRNYARAIGAGFIAGVIIIVVLALIMAINSTF